MIVTWLFILGLAAATIMIHLEGLWVTQVLQRQFRDAPRLGVLTAVMVCLTLHVLEISLYAVGFMLADRYFVVGQFNNETNLDAMAYFYYSAITFTAVGYGDILPTGDIRLLAVAESLNGLLLIGWSGAYTFLAMQRLWTDRALEQREARRALRNRRPAGLGGGETMRESA